MKNHIIRFALCLFFFGWVLNVSAQLNYPNTKKGNVIDDYHGTKVPDPYRWLENDHSDETKSWVKEQNKVTFSYLEKIPFRNKIKDRITKLWNYTKYGGPAIKSDYIFYLKNDGLQNQYVLYKQDRIDAEAKVFLDPNTFSDDGTVSLTNYQISKDGKYCVYGVSEAGSDWKKFYVMDVASKKKLSDELKWIKFSSPCWHDRGFYYTRFNEPEKGNELSEQNTLQRIYYHQVGTPQSDDKLIYEDLKNPKRYYDVEITEDNKYMFIYISEGASGTNAIYYRDLSVKNSKILPLINDFSSSYHVIENLDGKLLVLTNKDAPKKKVVQIDPKNPDPKNWTTFIPESNEILRSVSIAGKSILAVTMKDVTNQMYIYDLTGKLIKKIELPGVGTVSSVTSKLGNPDVFFTFNSYTQPPTIYHLDIMSQTLSKFKEPKIPFSPNDYVTSQTFYKSKDGTKVPIFISHKKGLEKNGKNPTILYAYGGFNISLNPRFNPATLAFLDAGGIYVVANLRGGSEYGEEWHKAGMLLKKQTVFDDFIAAAEYLIQEKYTSSSYLAINGGSNGGLLVGAVMTQKPDLFKVAIPQVGVMDMLRFHKFTVGWGWVSEYGSSDDAVHFKNLINYSPIHNIKENQNYPATMVMTADHDDRVVPAHSFKFAATLQEKYKGKEPMLIRIETQAGHGAGKPTSKIIEEYADKFAFVLYNMNITPKL